MNTIIQLLQNIWNFISSVASSFFQAIEMLVESVDFLTNFVEYLPTVISSGVMLFLSVYLIRFLLLK